MFKNNPGLLGAAILANNGNVGRGFMDASRAQGLASQAQMKNKLAQMQMQQLQAQMAQQQAQQQARANLSQQYPNIAPIASAYPSIAADLYKSQLIPSDDRTTMQKNYDFAKSQGYKGSFMDFQLEKAKAGATSVNNFMTGKLSPGQETLDKEQAKQIAEFETGGGYADTMKNLSQLQEVKKKLETQDNLTGPIVGSVPSFVAPIVTPEAVDTKEQVEEVVQRNLRLILGAQFTEKEGERLISRAYNPKLEESVNAKRVTRLMDAIEAALIQKQSASEYFKKNGTMRGWQGQMPTLNDFYSAIDESDPNTVNWEDL